MAFLAALGPRDRRALVVLAAVAGSALAWILLLRPAIDDVRRLREAIDVETATLARERAAIDRSRIERGGGPGGEALADSVRPRLFGGRDDAIAGAALAAWIGDAADASDVWVQSAVADATTREIAGLRVLSAELRGEGDVTGVVQLLDALARGPLFTEVTTLAITARPVDGTTDGTEPLSITLRARGFAEEAR